MPQSAVFNAFSVLGIPNGDTQITSDLGTGVPKTRGCPNHCVSKKRKRDLGRGANESSLDFPHLLLFLYPPKWSANCIL